MFFLYRPIIRWAARRALSRDGDKTGYRSQPLLELRVGSLLDPGVETVTKKR